MTVRCGRGHYHESIALVRACYNGDRVPDLAQKVDAEEPKPSGKQIRFVEGLLRKAGLCYLPGLDSLNRRTASVLINDLLDPEKDKLEHPDYEAANAESIARASRIASAKNKAPAFDPETLVDGFYAYPSPAPGAEDAFEVYKVIVAVHRSGRKYAKRLDVVTGTWEQARGAVRKLRPDMRMTLDQALAVARNVNMSPESRLYGRCFRCGRVLTKEESIGRMMGDTCAGKFAWASIRGGLGALPRTRRNYEQGRSL